MRWFRGGLFFFGALFAWLARAGSPVCGQAQLIAPVAGTITDPQPELRWTPVDGATGYRVRLISRVPEGKALVSLDTNVLEPRFKPPQPLTDYRARVQLTVQALCGGQVGPISDAARGRFSIDAAALCAAPDSFSVERTERGIGVSWRTSPAARSYEVAAYSVSSGELLRHQEVVEPRARFDDLGEAPIVLAVRGRCSTSWSLPAYQSILSRRD